MPNGQTPDPSDERWTNVLRLALVITGFVPVIAMAIFVFTHGLTAESLRLLVLAEAGALLFALGLVVLHAIATGQLDISRLLCESNGNASVARFQLLIFTFTIAMSLIFLVLSGPGKFPDIPWQVLALVGISASTYAGGKFLQNQSDANNANSGGQDGAGAKDDTAKS